MSVCKRMARGRFTSLACVALALASLAAAFALAASVAVPAAHAAAGTVYSCAVHPVYRHPVTGAIEDAGGSSSSATGQAMVDSCVSSRGMMEVTDAGECYLTIRLSLIDLTSGHDFKVQDRGASGWSVPAMGVTATGSDSNGTTNDVCIGLPSSSGIVRVSMFADPMGRDVVFYVYVDGFEAGAPAGFTPTIVTEASAGSGDAAAAAADPAPAAEAPAEVAAEEPAPAVASEEGDSLEGSEVPSAQGLSLSTAPDAGEVSSADEPSAQAVSLSLVEMALAAFLVGVGLMLVAAFIVYVFRRNWSRWGDVDPDDYSREYRDE